MAKKQSLASIGKVLGLVGGIVAIVEILLGLVNRTVVETPVGTVVETGVSLLDAVIGIIFAVILILMCSDRVNIDNLLVLGILVIVFGLLVGGGIGGLLAIIGGILIVIDYFS